MPELPEVETLKRELESAIVGKKISSVRVFHPLVIREPSAEKFIQGISAAKVVRIIRKGKLLIFELSTESSLAVHLKMTGQLVYPGDGVKSRVTFFFTDGSRLDFKDQRLFGELRLLKDWRSLKFIRELGPEPFEISFEQFRMMLANKKTKIKPLLLDQTFVSGIGNLYAAEVLFGAGINPGRQANSLSEKEAKLLFEQIKKILAQAIEYKGSSVDDFIRLTGEPGDYVRFHKVYNRQGKSCMVCKTEIKRVALGGRGTYFCPKCQK